MMEGVTLEWNWAHVHLVLNHIPIVGVPIVLFFLLAGLWMKDRGLIRVSLFAFAVLGALALVVGGAGIAAQGIVLDEFQNLEGLIYDHRVAGIISMVLMVLLGAWSGWGVAVLGSTGAPKTVNTSKVDTGAPDTRAQKSVRMLYPTGAAILAVVTSGILFWTAARGTKISHPEVVRNHPTQQEATERVPAAAPTLADPIQSDSTSAPAPDRESGRESGREQNNY